MHNSIIRVCHRQSQGLQILYGSIHSYKFLFSLFKISFFYIYKDNASSTLKISFPRDRFTLLCKYTVHSNKLILE